MKKVHMVGAAAAAVFIMGIFAFLIFSPSAESTKGGENMADDYFLDSQPDTEITEINEEELEAPVSNPEFVMVDVKGMVASPGVYELQQDKRIVDALDMAGGLAKHADGAQVNFAARLQDEMVIYVPAEGEEADHLLMDSSVYDSEEESQGDKVSLNTAEAAELETLPGIGPAKAAAILAYREENGLFTSAEELKEVSGIGDKTYEQLQEHITIE